MSPTWKRHLHFAFGSPYSTASLESFKPDPRRRVSFVANNHRESRQPEIMSFTTIMVRAGPARLASQLVARAPTMRAAFHQSATKNSFFTSRTASLALRSNTKTSSSGILSRLSGASRGYHQQYQYVDPTARRKELLRKVLIGAGIFGGTLVTVNVMFNGESRGAIPTFERSYLHKTFVHTGLGIGIIGLSAYQMVQSGFVYRIMQTNPWVVGLGGLALSMGFMFGTRAVDPDK